MGYNYAEPYLCFALCYKEPCSLIGAFKGDSEHYNSIAARVYRIGVENENSVGMWLRVSFNEREQAKNVLQRLKKNRMRSKIIYTAKNNFVIYVNHPSPCSNECPLLRTPPKVMVKTAIITGMGILFELLSFSKKHIESFMADYKCKALACGTLKEAMKYFLTSKEQEALHLAYSRGYYDRKRKTRLRELAKELNMSTSTLNEILRSAEGKVIEAFIKHDLPHLTFENIVFKKLKNEKLPEKSKSAARK